MLLIIAQKIKGAINNVTLAPVNGYIFNIPAINKPTSKNNKREPNDTTNPLSFLTCLIPENIMQYNTNGIKMVIM